MSQILERALCAYVDVLGFQDQIKATDESKEFALFHSFAATFEESSARIRAASVNLDRLKFKSFTDNVVVAYSVINEMVDLIHLCELLANYQLTLVWKNGLFLRGGISIGGMVIERDMILGKCFLTSHDLEKKAAIAPRIIIDPSLKQLILDKRSGLEDAWRSALDSWLWCDFDGHLFVNYLEAVKNLRATPMCFTVDSDQLAQHRQQVERCLAENRHQLSVWFKYFWVANYHNHFCDINNQPGRKIAQHLLLPMSNGVMI